jgi:environmental stress-induced protein Ves
MTPAALHTVSLAQTPQQPWRNGGGFTQELLAWPSAAGWQCRISVARIDSNGPFSAFPGVERWFTVLSGEGVVLRLGKQRTLLAAGSEPLRFEGAAAPQCDLLGGPTQDLNLMLKSDHGRGAMRAAQAGEHWDSDAPLRAVFAWDAATLLVDDQQPLNLPAGTLAWCVQAARQSWHVKASSPLSAPAPRAWWLHFKPIRS